MGNDTTEKAVFFAVNILPVYPKLMLPENVVVAPLEGIAML